MIRGAQGKSVAAGSRVPKSTRGPVGSVSRLKARVRRESTDRLSADENLGLENLKPKFGGGPAGGAAVTTRT